MRNVIVISMCWLCCAGCADMPDDFKSYSQRQAEQARKDAEIQKLVAESRQKDEPEKQRGRDVRSIYLEQHADITPEIRKAISEADICIGMSVEQVLISWGAPWNKHETVTAHGYYLMLEYQGWDWKNYRNLPMDQRSPGSIYLFFTNGVLTQYQQ